MRRQLTDLQLLQVKQAKNSPEHVDLSVQVGSLTNLCITNFELMKDNMWNQRLGRLPKPTSLLLRWILSN